MEAGIKNGYLIDLLKSYPDDTEIEIEIYETITGHYVDTTADIAIAEDTCGLVFRIDVEAEKLRKCLG